MQNKYHVLPKRFHLNSHIIGFLPQTRKLDQCYKPPSFSLVYLPTISESNAFSSCRDWNFLTFLMIFWRLPKVAENVRRSSHGLFNDNILVSCDKKRLFGLFSGITICPDLWVRHEKLSLMHEIDVLSLQAWDSHIMRESWQVLYSGDERLNCQNLILLTD